MSDTIIRHDKIDDDTLGEGMIKKLSSTGAKNPAKMKIKRVDNSKTIKCAGAEKISTKNTDNVTIGNLSTQSSKIVGPLLSKNARKRAARKALKRARKRQCLGQVAKSAEPAVTTITPHPLLLSGAVSIKTLPPSLLASVSFEKVWELRLPGLGKVYHKDGPVAAHRLYASFGKTPARRSGSTTYMFSADGIATKSAARSIPKMFRPILDHLNTLHGHGAYNQLVVNWYCEGRNYTPFHMDCLDGMIDKATVATVTLVDEKVADAESRRLVFKPAQNSAPNLHLRIPTTNGQIIIFGGDALTKWRHGIPKTKGDVARRISLSFRSYT